MALATKPSSYVSPEEYLLLEETAQEKSEYFDGVVTLMAGGSENHNSISLNVTSNLRIGLRGTSCRAFGSETRLLVKKNGLYTYPDMMVVCNKIDRTDTKTETVTNPTLIVEVLSPSTEAHDRSKKFERYRDINTFCEYILIHQDRPFIEQYHKNEENEWLIRFIQGMNATLVFESIEYELPFSLIYEYVEWDS